LPATLGFSARLTAGGPLAAASRLSSADLRGGGGDGGRDDGKDGDLVGSTAGVWGLLGILKGFGEDVPEGEFEVSTER
jgi:hypothetical protein